MNRNPIVFDDVNGVIIGGEYPTIRYEFYSKPEYPTYIAEYIDRNWFTSDAEAEEWFKAKYPEWYRKGIEMRVFDLPVDARHGG